MKNLKTFRQFINESKLNEAVSIKTAVKLFKDANYSAASFIEEKKEGGYDEIAQTAEAVCKHLGEKPENVFIADEYSGEEDRRLNDVYDTISSKIRHNPLDLGLSDDAILAYDPSMNVVAVTDKYDGFIQYYFTHKSKL